MATALTYRTGLACRAIPCCGLFFEFNFCARYISASVFSTSCLQTTDIRVYDLPRSLIAYRLPLITAARVALIATST